jgi:thiamine biosynthesis protein ThiS
MNDHGPVTLTVNGEPRGFPPLATIADLLGHLGLDPRMVVVEHNRRIVRRPELAATPVAEGDVIELVHFVGGG